MQTGSSSNADRTLSVIAPDPARGHTYGNAILESGATAHFGDRYTSLHIHVANNHSRSPSAGPLTVNAAVRGIIVANDKLVKIISSVINIPSASQILKDLQTELSSVNIIVSCLENFLRRTNAVAPARAALIPVQDVVSVMTQLVLVYSELQAIVQQWQGTQQSILSRLSTSWIANAPAIKRLLNQLQRHKSSLSLVLQIISCGSQFEAEQTADVLQSHTDRELEEDSDLADRLQQLELPPGITFLDNDSRILTAGVDDELLEPEPTQPLPTSERLPPQCDVPSHDAARQESFNEIIASSRVYRRVEKFEIDAMTTTLSTRSHGWSALSGVTSARITTIGVICLPLHESELERFLTAGGSMSSVATEKAKGGHRSPTQINMLSQAEAIAKRAVLLDEAENAPGAIEGYVEVCDILEQLMVGISDNLDRKKLSAIRAMYSARMAELSDLDNSFEPPPGFARSDSFPKVNVPTQPVRPLASNNSTDSTAESPGTPGLTQLLSNSTHSRQGTISIPPVSNTRPSVLSNTAVGGMYIFDPTVYGSLSPSFPDAMESEPLPLEPCPESFLLRPFWLMRCLYQTLAHSKGGYISTKLFIPRDIWRVEGVKIKAMDDKADQCDVLTTALLKLAKVDTLDADAVLDELQSFDSVIDTVRINLALKLGNDVGLAGAVAVMKNSPAAEDQDALGSKSASSVKSFPSSWRKFRSKSSSAALPSTNARKGDFVDDAIPTLPMTANSAVITSRGHKTQKHPAPTPTAMPHIPPQYASYMSSLARLFNAVQILDSIARQVEDPGLKVTNLTQVRLELSIRGAAEFFSFYVVRFALADIGIFLDKYIKRSSEEWAML